MSKPYMTPDWADVKPVKCYVYIHRRLTDGSPFYVGKGQSKRGWAYRNFEARSLHWINTASKHGVRVEIAQDDLSDSDAYLLEMWLIAKFKRDGHALVNLTDGGDGYRGGKPWNKSDIHCSNGMTFDSARAAVSWLRANGWPSAHATPLGMCCTGKQKIAYGYKWSKTVAPDVFFSPKKITVCSNGMRFNTGAEAREWLKANGHPSASQGNVAMVCRGEREFAYGYKWHYE